MWFFKRKDRIKGLGRAGIEYVEQGKVLLINAEFAADPLSVVINGKSKLSWKPPHDDETITEEKRLEILNKTVKHYESKGFEVELVT